MNDQKENDIFGRYINEYNIKMIIMFLKKRLKLMKQKIF